MSLQLIGAGLPRTGTNSLQLALQQLLGGPCYHMHEVFERPNDAPVWQAAAQGSLPDWQSFLAGYSAVVDWPPSAFWEPLAAAFPQAPVFLSTRSDAQTWWSSVSKTIIPATQMAEDTPWRSMAESLFKKFVGDGFTDGEKMMAAYEAHNAHVRATVSASRLIEWQPQDGWAPLCEALKLPVPAEPFPHVNTKEEFAARIGRDVPAPKT